MSTEKSPSPNEIRTFIILLKHYGLYQPEELYKVICPFHDDRNASMQININKAFFYCYAECGAKGGSLELYRSFHLLQHQHEKSYEPPSDLQCLLAIKKLVRDSDQNSIPMPDALTNNYTSNSSSSVESSKVSYREGLTQARDFYYNLPETNWYKPGIEEGTEAKHYMKHRGFSASLLKQSGAKCSFNRWYPIVFPMFENGIFRGYVMRTFDPEVEANRKYMYNRGFKRERTLAGSFGKKAGSDTVLIVEGYLDKLKANQLGIKNVAAILGWKLTQTQIQKLQKAGVKRIICGTDNDEAGKKGFRYMKRIAPHTGFSVERLRYPKGIKDMGDVKPDSKEANMVLNQIYNFGGK